MARSRANIANRKKHILLKISLTLFVLILLLSTATYTWFSLSRTPKVNDMAIYINSNVGMDISWDPNDDDSWGQHLNYSEKYPDRTMLRPVTYSYENNCFFAAKFSPDGKITEISHPLRDDRHTNRSDIYGYYVKTTFYAKANEDVKVTLLGADRQTGTYAIGTPKWDGENLIHVDGGGGAQYAIRIGFRITPLDSNKNPDTSKSHFVIYEPNSTNHINYQGDYITRYIKTPSIDGSEELLPNGKIIRQSATLWTEMDPIQMDLVEYKYGEFLDDTTLFYLDSGTISQIDMYLWLEGQDYDCTNLIGEEAEIFSSIQFFTIPKEQSGMDPIE